MHDRFFFLSLILLRIEFFRGNLTPTSNEMKHEDLVEYSKIFALEFNNSGLHDRVLVFEFLEGDSCNWVNALNSSMSKITSKEMSCSRDCKVASGRSPDTDYGHSQKTKTEDGKEVGDEEEKGIKGENEGESRDTKGEITEEKRPHAKSCKGQKIQSEDEKKNKIEGKGKNVKEVGEGERKNKEGKKQEEEETKKNRGMKSDEAKDKEKADDGLMANQVGTREKVVREENLVRDLEDYNSTNEHNDTEKHKVFVHSSWLAVQSPYFRELFYSGKKELSSKNIIMKIYRSELQAYSTLLEAMYNLDVLDNKEYHLVAQVLILANKYDVQMVLRKCKYVLLSILESTPLSLEKCECILHAVKDLSGCADIYGILERFLVKEFSPLDKTLKMDRFLKLSEESLGLLLSSNNLTVQSENSVFLALMVWLENNEKTSPDVSTLLNLVRFELMTADFLYDFVRNHHLAKRMPSFYTFFHKGLAYHAFSQRRQNNLQDPPVKRLELKDAGPSFSWVINRDGLQEANDLANDMYSALFLCQGYEIQLRLRCALDKETYGFYLYILNLKKGSFVNINWKAQSDLFLEYSVSGNSMYEYGKSTDCGKERIEKSFLELNGFYTDKSCTINVWIELI